MSQIRECAKNLSTLVITMLLLLVGCQTNGDQRDGGASVELSFVESEVAAKATRVVKSLKDADGLVVSIHGEDSEEARPSSAIQLFRIGDSYVSRPIFLIPGTCLSRQSRVMTSQI